MAAYRHCSHGSQTSAPGVEQQCVNKEHADRVDLHPWLHGHLGAVPASRASRGQQGSVSANARRFCSA